jgi:hypothetical protein
MTRDWTVQDDSGLIAVTESAPTSTTATANAITTAARRQIWCRRRLLDCLAEPGYHDVRARLARKPRW